MKKILLLILGISIPLIPGLGSSSQAQSRDPRELVRKIDELYRSTSSQARVEMEIVTPDWSRTLALNGWSKGLDKMFIRILEPKKESGVGTLRLGNEMWNYLPKTDKVIKIPPSMMMSSWMGSDFTNDDLVKEFTFVHDFVFAMTTPDDAQAGLAYVECRPKPGVPVIWDRIVIDIEEATLLPVRQTFFDENGRVARIMNYKEIRTFGARTVPSVMEMIPQNKEGYKTVIRYKDIRFDFPLEDGIFTLRNLQSWK
jgi:outer membrane lipoprotein-sorting protein